MQNESERPVPTTDEPDWQTERDRTLVARLRDDRGPVRERMNEAADRIERLEALPVPQPPTREQIAVELIEKLRNTGGVSIDRIWTRWRELFREYDDAVLTLLPEMNEMHKFDPGRYSADGIQLCRARSFDGDGIPAPCHRPISDSVHIDPSTIRDVTPPKS